MTVWRARKRRFQCKGKWRARSSGAAKSARHHALLGGGFGGRARTSKPWRRRGWRSSRGSRAGDLEREEEFFFDTFRPARW